MDTAAVSRQTLLRLPAYLAYLKSLPKDRVVNISATTIAEALGLNDVQVRKDLASVSSGGRPKIGYVTQDLIIAIEQYLGYDNADNAVIVGTGNLGRALLSYREFSTYGLNIVAAFDVDPAVVGTQISGRPVLAADTIKDLCTRLKIRIGIITVPAADAQAVCDDLVESGVLALWNFAPIRLQVPEGVLVQHENLAFSLAMLSKHLKEDVLPSKL